MSEKQATMTTVAPPEFEVRLSGDKLLLLVTMADPHQNLADAAALIAAQLPPFDLAEEIAADLLEPLLAQACEPGADLVDHPLLTGQLPEPPRDGEIQWQKDYFASGFAMDEANGRVDYWERAEQRAVKADQLLAVVLTPLEGKPGRTLQGNDAPVAKARPARLRPGKGVRATEEGDRILIHAAVSGRVSFKDGTVTVDDVYTVRGDVCLETGNIHHTGALVVQGDVKEGACIECEGDVLIKGLVEPCNITCGGNLTVNGGVVGDREHRLDVASTVHARYLNDVNLRCGGDITVTSQIDHSHVETLGQITIVKGRIAGGVVKAYKGLHVGHAGASGATSTVIVAGADYRLDEQQRERKDRMVQLQEIRDELHQHVERAVAQGIYDDKHRAGLAALKAKMATIDKALQDESDVLQQETEESLRDSVREVAVHIGLFSGVTFQLGGAKVVSDRSTDQPRLVTLRRGKARILPMGEQNTPDAAPSPSEEE